MSDDATVDIYWAINAQEAHEIKAVLERAGIRATVVGEMLAGGVGELPMGPSVSPRVWVSKADENKARQLCAAWEKERVAVREKAAESWTCPRCGETVEGHFDVCWKCQAVRGE